MKKVICLFGILVFSLATGLGDAIAAKPGGGGGGCSVTNGRIEVSTTGDCTSIQDAIDVTVGDPVVIDVLPGTYSGGITMKDYIHLQGAGAEVTTIQPDSANETIYALNVSSAAISDFTIDCAGAADSYGIWNEASSPSISGNKIINCKMGIVNEVNSSPMIKDNLFESDFLNGTAIENYDSNASIFGNTIIKYSTAVHEENSSSSIVGNNIIGRYGDGIKIISSSPLIQGNKMTDCGNCLSIEASSPTVIGNMIIGYTDPARYTHTGHNIYISELSGSAPIIKDNILTKGYTGIYYRNNSPSIRDNIITENRFQGIDGGGSSMARIISNDVSGNCVDTSCNESEITVQGNEHISFNIFDTIDGATWSGGYNMKSDGTSW